MDQSCGRAFVCRRYMLPDIFDISILLPRVAQLLFLTIWRRRRRHLLHVVSRIRASLQGVRFIFLMPFVERRNMKLVVPGRKIPTQAWQSLPLGKMLGRQFLRQLLECTFLLQMLACRFLQQMLECKFLGVLQQMLRCKFLQQTWERKFLQQMLACMFLQQMLEGTFLGVLQQALECKFLQQM
ncbi:unnamed protein product [Prorocentrum cordatum]|uniref:Uncharacterized protein n=1 Tax=Prorocentrum cordatum TaxID=2364126 RepID=A0ABN9XVV8_9DINO|nr:unnamed protein product [Polarella glacialis]